MRPKCSIQGCEDPVFVLSRGWCKRHYTRWVRTGDPSQTLSGRVEASAEERAWAKVDKDGPIPDFAPHLGPCWLWTGGHTSNGYGAFAGGTAHRFMYQTCVGPIEAGLVLDHLCRVRSCVNPAHLEPVTNATNVRRGIQGTLKVQCAQGHPYVDPNIYTHGGRRYCRLCTLDAQRRKRAAMRTTRSEAHAPLSAPAPAPAVAGAAHGAGGGTRAAGRIGAVRGPR